MRDGVLRERELGPSCKQAKVATQTTQFARLLSVGVGTTADDIVSYTYCGAHTYAVSHGQRRASRCASSRVQCRLIVCLLRLRRCGQPSRAL